MTLPIYPVVMPSDLAGLTNGKLPATVLTQVHARGVLHKTAARCWAAFVAAAANEGLPLTFTYGGMYRSYAEQESLFRSRYSPTGTLGDCKRWNGVLWCKIPVNGKKPATAAVPGSSNHGWALAIDCAFDTDPSDGLGPDDAAAITAHPKFTWFRDNAIKFGFSFELQSEPWHLRLVCGDSIPQAVLEYEAGRSPLAPPSPTRPTASYAVLAMTDKFEFAEAARWDTRGFGGGGLPAGEYKVQLNGSAGKVGAKVNLAIVPAPGVGGGFATVWGQGVRPADKSAINWSSTTESIANQIDVGPLEADGTFKVFISSPAHIIFDLVGYWS